MNMIYEIIAILLVLDSLGAVLFAFTKLGDDSIEKLSFIKRYLPLTKGWASLYLVLALYITYLTFGII
jgi:hypothetical protein